MFYILNTVINCLKIFLRYTEIPDCFNGIPVYSDYKPHTAGNPSRILYLQGDQLNMAVFFLYPEKKARQCLTGQPVCMRT